MKKIYLSALIIFAAFNIELSAGPTVIRDNRITDIGTTPVLGRGYSIGTNTYQSTCLKDVQITEPSYDMEYTFESIEDSLTETTSKENQTNADISVSYKSNSKRYGKSSSRGLDWALSTQSKTTTIDGVTAYNHRVLVTIDIFTYYASVDEGKSPMSESAKQLLVNRDLPGFFNSCGAYYVRSIGRKASFVSIFTYTTKETTRDIKFESQLKTEIQAFSSGSARGAFGLTKSDYSLSASASYENARKESFHSEAANKHLSIVTHAYGLGKDEKASLISYDLETFKAAIRDAFISMQNPNTGKVATIEIVPWVENTEFQSAVKLDEKTETAEGENDADGGTETLLLYEKKHILTQNAEFLIEVERADRNLMNMYYKAKLCRSNIDVNWKTDGRLMDEYKDAMIASNRNGDKQPLKKLDDTLSDTKLKQLLDAEKQFMYGTASGASGGKSGGASACIRAIMKTGFFNKSYREIKECEPVYGQLGDVQSDFVNDYCMPVLAP